MSSQAPPVLALPAGFAARRLALRFLRDGQWAAERIARSDDPAALRAFRLAVRRLRCVERAFREELGDAFARPARRVLREIAREVGRAHELTARLATLEAIAARSADENGAADRLAADIRTEVRALQGEIVGSILPRFHRVRQRLRPALRRYSATVSIDGREDPRAFREVLAGRVEHLAQVVIECLAGMGPVLDRDRTHRARVATSRLRYLLEPVRAEIPAANPVIAYLRGIQALLGGIGEADRMADHLAAHASSPDLLALAEKVRDHRTRLVDEFAQALANAAFAEFEADIEQVRREIQLSSTDADLEIERKYLLDGMPDLPPDAVETLEVEQGWLPGIRILERFRKTRSTSGETFHRAIKLGAGVARIEIEEPVDAELFARLWAMTEGRRVRKTRYRVRDGGHVWEIDRFHDVDLVVAEIELGHATESVRYPSWLAPRVMREVTDDPAYLNVNLAR
jgi:adenylate cyclase